MIHCNERHIFLCLFFLLTITGRNEVIIVELKVLVLSHRNLYRVYIFIRQTYEYFHPGVYINLLCMVQFLRLFSILSAHLLYLALPECPVRPVVHKEFYCN